MSAENADDIVLESSPAVISTLRDFPAACAERERTEDPEIHMVASHRVCPTSKRDVTVVSPNPAPCTVIDTEPDPTTFPIRPALKVPVSIEKAIDKLAVELLTETATRRVPCAPREASALIDVSDSQCVSSHPEPPVRIICENPEPDPNPAPKTVTLVVPVDA
jgi:hypothetical protein